MAAAVVKRFAETVSCFTFNADKTKLALCPNNTEIHIYAKKGAEWVEEVVLTEVSDTRKRVQSRGRLFVHRSRTRSFACAARGPCSTVTLPRVPLQCARGSARGRKLAGFFPRVDSLIVSLASGGRAGQSLDKCAT